MSKQYGRRVSRLIARLRREGYAITDDAVFARTRHGRNQLAVGGWSWSINWDQIHELGSADTVEACLRAKSLTFIGHGELVAE